jgi:hypothetical protein
MTDITEIVKQIKAELNGEIVKKARPFGFSTDDAAPAKPKGGGGGGGAGAATPSVLSNEVAEMQKIMADIASIIEGKSKEVQGSKDGATNIKAFNDFLVEKHTNSTNLRATDKSDPEAKVHTELAKLLTTFVNTGSSKNPTKVDGNWGLRTNAALWDIIAYSNALLQLRDGLGIQTTAQFSSSQTVELSTLAYQDAKALQAATDKKERAAKAIPLLLALKEFCKELFGTVMNDPTWIQYLHGAPHALFDPSEKDRFKMEQSDDAEIKDAVIPDSQKPGPIDGKVYVIKGQNIPPTHLSSLMDADAFKAYMVSLGKDPEDIVDIKQVLKNVMEAIGMQPGMSAAAPKETTSTVAPPQGPAQSSGKAVQRG